MLYKDVNLINTEIDMYRTIITPEEIRTVAKKISKSKPTISIRLSIIRQSQKIIQNHHEKQYIY
jgi:ribosome-binding ATPase YchF (GTP1/OBG family)